MPISEDFYKTNAVYKSWIDNPFKFIEPTEANNSKGLRRPQIAALYTALGYLASSPEKPATVVMPTGTGKTDAIFSLIIAGHFPRTLIIVPSDALREQTSEKIVELKTLRDIGAINENTAPPKILKISSKLEIEQLKKAEGCNVVIATPQAITLFNEDELIFLAELCSHLIIDEAHHVAARTWKRVKKAFTNKPCIQFTATPFREDGESLEGSIIYNYPLREAQNEKYFQEIEFHPIREYQPSAADRSIAEKAVALLREDLADGKDHIMMVRVKSQKRAGDLFKIYKEHEDLNPVLIHSSTKGKKNTLDNIKSKKHKIIVCVNMLGEGFDLPELKIAAIHDQHCSPAVTLQFIGRLTRANKNLGAAKFVANIANQKMDAQMSALYEESADWSAVIREVSEKKIKREIQKQELNEKFANKEEGERILSLNPTPNISATAYTVKKDEWNPENIYNYHSSLEKVELVTISDTNDIVIMVTKSETSVGWANTAEIKNTEWFLYLAYYSENEKTLFINSSGDEGQTAKFRNYLVKEFIKIDGERTFRALHNIDFLRLQNVGLSRSNKDLRFTMHVGRDISAIINDLETGTAIKSNIFAAGYEGGEKTTAGCSYKGKFWEMNSESIDYWVQWCIHTGKKLKNPDIDTKDIIRNAMQAEPVREKWPTGIFYADWPDEIAIENERKVYITLNGESHSLIDLELGTPLITSEKTIEIPLVRPDRDNNKILNIKILLLADSYRIECPGKISLQKDRALSEYLSENPPRLLKQDGSFIRGNYRYYSAKTLNVKIPIALIEAWDWGDTSLNKESMGPEGNLKTVQGSPTRKLKKNIS